MHQNNNDITKSEYEWTLSRYGADSGNFGAWIVISDGYVSNNYVYDAGAVRPVFYLTSNQKISSGDGSLDDSFMLAE